MSSCPGLTLEAFIAWEWNLLVEGYESSNMSLFLVETIFGTESRKKLSLLQFEQIVDLYEPYREEVEYRLEDFDKDWQSWRDYAGNIFAIIPPEIRQEANQLIINFLKE